MKKGIGRALMLLMSLAASSSFAQEQELAHFRQELSIYQNYQLGRNKALTVNSTNNLKYRKRLDGAFEAFVLHEKSAEYEKFISPDPNGPFAHLTDLARRFIPLSEHVTIDLRTFKAGGKIYLVYSYQAGLNNDYFIKEKERNIVVYQGKLGGDKVVDIFQVDDVHMLLIEDPGSCSRFAFVVSSAQNPWSKISGFEGVAWSERPGKTPVKRREHFSLSCDQTGLINAPQDINLIRFDEKTKILSYRQYAENGAQKLIKAKWEAGVFKLDDYNANAAFDNQPGIVIPR